MKRTVALVLCAILLGGAVTAHAQASGRSRTDERPPVEVGGFYGYSWTWSQSTSIWNGTTYVPGDVDVEDSDFWGVNIDYPLAPGFWVELLYSNQTSDLTFKDRIDGKRTLSELGVEYWHIGAVRALKLGKVVPFTSLSLGTTKVNAKALDETNWRFSMILGVGAKIYASERVGLRAQARLPVTFTGGGLGFGVGTGGASAGFYGTGVTQIDLSAGAFLRF